MKLEYRGLESYLKPEENKAVVDWLKSSNVWDFEELVTYIHVNYGVTYQARQSYDDLYSEAGITWKESQKMNPKSHPILVQKKADKIRDLIGKNQSKIESGQMVVLFVDVGLASRRN